MAAATQWLVVARYVDQGQTVRANVLDGTFAAMDPTGTIIDDNNRIRISAEDSSGRLLYSGPMG